ncbi:hypothetical protein [Streptomyces sp. NPDC101115]|uniref:hypothetical protein n=1 Tax=Streptomyces sp. NPDC101115 TaxID=3366106 RepID=UPI003803EB58
MTMKVLAEALRRDAAAPLEQYEDGRWVLEQAERELAEGLARGQWCGAFLRDCLRDVPSAVRAGRLIDVLATAADVLDRGALDRDVVLQLRVLVDALAPEL